MSSKSGQAHRLPQAIQSDPIAPMRFALLLLRVASMIALVDCSAKVGAAPLGIFDDHSDVGAPKRTGAAEFDAAQRSYKITGGGKNRWFAK